jgi:valyl-tRNA synthetase
VRAVRLEKKLPNREELQLLVRVGETKMDQRFVPVLKKMAVLSDVQEINEKPDNTVSFLVKTNEYFIPLSENFDKAGEIDKIQKELEYTRGFLASVMKKLDNERFVQNAPENVLELERTKKANAESKIRTLEESLDALS